ncbi:MAG: MATE family efflux transporter [Bacillota bacterium]
MSQDATPTQPIPDLIPEPAQSEARALYSPTERRRVIFRLAWPVSAEMILGTLVQVIDMAMVGRLGAVAIAAVGLSFRPLFVGQAIFLGLGVATTAMVARFTGARQPDQANRVTEQALLTTSLLALALGLFAYLAGRQIVVFMGGEGEVVKLGTSYMRGIAPGLFFMLVATIMTAALRGAGDTQTPMKVNILTNLINVFGNWVLIFGHLGFPSLGVFGAAVATSFSRLVGAAIMFIVLLRGRGGLHLEAAGFRRLDMDLIGRLFRIGIPAALERMVMSVSAMIHIKIVATLGTVAVAAATVSSNAEQLSFMPAIGFSVAASALVGQNLGACNPKEAAQSGRQAIALGTIFMGLMGLLFFILPGLFVRIYTDQVEILASGIMLMRIVGLSQIPMAIGFVASGALRGAGDTSSVLLATVVSSFVVRLGLSYLLVVILGWGLWAAWMATLLDWAVRAAITAIRFRAGRWQQIEV